MKRLVTSALLSIAALLLFSQTPAHKLQKAYNCRSHKQLEVFFQDWRQEMPANDSLVTDDTLKAVYEIFNSFYNPMEIKGRGIYDEGISFPSPHRTSSYNTKGRYDKTRYFLVQSSIKLFRVDSVPSEPSGFWLYNISENRFRIDIDTFYPKTNFSNKVVYLSKERLRLLENFLEADTTYQRWGKVAPDSLCRIRSKANFLKPFIRPIYYKNYNKWLLTTWPRVSYVVFDSKLETVLIWFVKYKRGGYAVYHLENGQWKQVAYKVTSHYDY